MVYQLTRLRLCRLDRGLTLSDLGGRSSITAGRLAAIEEGWSRPTADEVTQLAAALGVASEALTSPTVTTVDVAPLRIAPATAGRRTRKRVA